MPGFSSPLARSSLTIDVPSNTTEPRNEPRTVARPVATASRTFYNTAGASSRISSVIDRKCIVCQYTGARFSCPRCGSSYCSLKCYHSHKRVCQVPEAAATRLDEVVASQQPASDNWRQPKAPLLPESVLEALAEPEQVIPSRAVDAAVLEAYTKDSDAPIAASVSRWVPWWRSVDEYMGDTQGSDPLPAVPVVDPTIAVHAKPGVVFQAVDVIRAYAVTALTFNGLVVSDKTGTAGTFLCNHATTLSDPQPPETMRSVLERWAADAVPLEFDVLAETRLLMSDVAMMARALGAAEAVLRAQAEGQPETVGRRLLSAAKRVAFMQGAVPRLGSDSVRQLRHLLL
ncbi:hypothetical protein J8273_1723 [Carpediemonas membranifera]|uniref:HIT-type domain-containing protein n=1 Tax=Carpediemonas membranifera TaxID=201153 RepID=A0A8J6B1Y8_9EUKA|nr:hypothetical protein J8273_1723 [Carpediemonas membranifera]|eukprot:KAG9396705.1 hypothetical protein J8273_1723 [Carpediemonas membranifera]